MDYESQSPAQNIEQEIDMMTWIIYGKMRRGKTVNAIRLALDFYPRIYSNVNIYHNGKSVVNLIHTYEQLDRIRFSYTHGVIVIDEAGLNANSKDTFSSDSRLLQRVLFLAGKKNCSVIWIAQRFESIDINARVLADVILKINKIRRPGGKHPIFTITKERQIGTKLVYIQKWKNDTIQELKNNGISYNTLEESVMTKTKDLQEPKTTKNIIGLKNNDD